MIGRRNAEESGASPALCPDAITATVARYARIMKRAVAVIAGSLLCVVGVVGGVVSLMFMGAVIPVFAFGLGAVGFGLATVGILLVGRGVRQDTPDR